MSHTKHSMGLNRAEKFIVDFYSLTNRHMKYEDAIELIKDGYPTAKSFINACEEYEKELEKHAISKANILL